MFQVLLIVLSTLVVMSNAYLPCIDFEPKPVDKAWYDENQMKWKDGMEMWEHSSCTTCLKDEEWKWCMGNNTPKHLCYLVDLVVNGKPMTVNFNCEFVELSKKYCYLETPVGGIKGMFSVGYQSNKSIAGTICLYGKEQMWFVMGPGAVDQVELDKALAALEELGFDINNKATDCSFFVFKRFTQKAC